MVVQIPRLVLPVAPPCQIALDIAMLSPPSVPAQQRCECIFDEPAVVESFIEAENGDRSHRRLRPVETLPPSRPRIVRHKPLLRLLAQDFDCIGIGKVPIANRCHCGGKKRVPVEKHVTAPANTPYSAHWRDDPLLVWFVYRIPTQRGFYGIRDRRGISGRGNGLLVNAALPLDRCLNF